MFALYWTIMAVLLILRPRYFSRITWTLLLFLIFFVLPAMLQVFSTSAPPPRAPLESAAEDSERREPARRTGIDSSSDGQQNPHHE